MPQCCRSYAAYTYSSCIAALRQWLSNFRPTDRPRVQSACVASLIVLLRSMVLRVRDTDRLGALLARQKNRTCYSHHQFVTKK